jgi:raffinose/stachyose/melibiose transport system substrate-binding protein
MNKTRWLIVTIFVVFGLLLVACASGTATEAPPAEQPPAEQPPAEEPPAEEPPAEEPPAEDMEAVTLRVLTWQNPPTVEFVEAFNEKFEAAHPNITVDYSVVNANDIQTVTQTRLTANDIDVIAMFGFANAAQPFMSEVEPQAWQQLVQAGLLMDLTGQPFVDNYDEATIRDAGTVDGKVYQVNLGRVSYSGTYYNKDLFAEYGVEVPTTWDELVAACETFKENDIECMTNGGADGWPIFVGAYGLLGALYPDQAAMVEGLWTGELKWDDPETLELWEKYQVYAQEMLEPGTSGIAGDAAPGRFASGAVAMFPNGVWYAGAIEDSEPDFEWGYIPFPGSDNAEDNQYLFGKYDMGWAIAANTPNEEAALLYLSEFSEPDNYQEFVNAVGFIPTQPGATLDTQVGQEVAPYLENFLVGFEQFWSAPKGAGQWANGSQGAAWFQPFGEWDDAAALAQQSQADLQAGLDTLE